EVSDFASPVIQSAINESLENVILAKSSFQPKLTYEAAASLTEFELKKIFLDKMKKSKLYRAAPEHRELYDGLVKSYKLDKDLFESYGKTYSLKRDRKDKDKDEDPPAGSDQGLKKQKTRKDVEPPKGSKSKDTKESKHDVYSTKRIIAATHVKVMKWYEYSYMEEIVVQREDRKLYKFMKGNFPRLNLRDIKDLVLLLVQKKLSNLEKNVIFDLNVALQMFTRRVVILKRVEDLHLGVKSYHNKLNLTKPETFRSNI
nr:hypothetical protein [Tanacetum cinerariifolium]